MTTITCDICNNTISGPPIKVTVPDGEHPHNGSRMNSTIDVCLYCCTSKIKDLTSKVEFDDLRKSNV